jgi:Predicted phosphoesterases, related to the Icc protein
MKVRVISDIHFDHVRDSINITYEGENLLVIAGDLCSFPTRLPGLHFIKSYLQSSNIPIVFYVLGNHEYYGSSIKTTEAFWNNQAKKTHGRLFIFGVRPRSFILNRIRFIGCTLWTDLNKGEGIWVAYGNLNDFKLIKDFVTNPRLYIKYHEDSVEMIRSFLKKKCQTVVLSHHPPSLKSVMLGDPKFRRLFSGNLETLIYKNPTIAAWLHGHIHASSDYDIKQCQVVCNPFFENQDHFIENKTITVYNFDK